MPLSTSVKNFRNGTIVLADGSATPITLTVVYENGDFAVNGLMEGQTEVTMYLDRGAFGSLRKTNFTPATFSFTAQMTEISDATNKNILDAVMRSGAFAAGVSTLGAAADQPWTLNVTWTIEGTDSGDASDHIVAMTNCRLNASVAEGDPNTFTVNGTCYGTITLT
jgi:hypothetical protein